MASKQPQPQPKDLPIDPKYDHFDFPTSAPTPQAGHPGYTTPEQDAQVFQLRKQLEEAGCKERLDTLTLLRFLRARKFNVEASKAMYALHQPPTHPLRLDQQGTVDCSLLTWA